ncbi:MAG: hypothetical protein MUF12_05095 [Sediminibacterium sp.]|nr:hypothetical protein [Sediminibacterium sp.]
MGTKKAKGSVSVENYRNRIRLRWRYQGKRYSLNLGVYNKTNLAAIKKTVQQIELVTCLQVRVGNCKALFWQFDHKEFIAIIA